MRYNCAQIKGTNCAICVEIQGTNCAIYAEIKGAKIRNPAKFYRFLEFYTYLQFLSTVSTSQANASVVAQVSALLTIATTLKRVPGSDLILAPFTRVEQLSARQVHTGTPLVHSFDTLCNAVTAATTVKTPTEGGRAGLAGNITSSQGFYLLVSIDLTYCFYRSHLLFASVNNW